MSHDEDTVEILRPVEIVDMVRAEAFDEPGLSIAATTHQGKVRRTNEDQYAVLRRTRCGEVLATSLGDHAIAESKHYAWLLAVADGLGGHVSGEVASATAMSTILNFANTLSSWVMKPTDGLREDFQERVELYAQAIQSELQKQADANPSLTGMATTVTAVYVFGSNALVVNLGDSRAYLLRSRQMHQITRDHTLGRDLQEKGLSPKEVRPYRNILTRCFNTRGKTVDIDIFHLDLAPEDQLLLCTDGLTDMVKDIEILRLIGAAESTKHAAEKLVKTALENGGRDNVTLVLGHVRAAT